MRRLLIVTLGAALAGSACGTTASDATDRPLPAENRDAAGASNTPPRASDASPIRAQAGPAYREVTIPAGTTLPLALTSSVASDTSVVEDPVIAELTSPITIDGRDVLPTGARLAGVVTGVAVVEGNQFLVHVSANGKRKGCRRERHPERAVARHARDER